jgi:hypothetical protein
MRFYIKMCSTTGYPVRSRKTHAGSGSAWIRLDLALLDPNPDQEAVKTDKNKFFVHNVSDSNFPQALLRGRVPGTYCRYRYV